MDVCKTTKYLITLGRNYQLCTEFDTLTSKIKPQKYPHFILQIYVHIFSLLSILSQSHHILSKVSKTVDV